MDNIWILEQARYNILQTRNQVYIRQKQSVQKTLLSSLILLNTRMVFYLNSLDLSYNKIKKAEVKLLRASGRVFGIEGRKGVCTKEQGIKSGNYPVTS